jgi:hypothetical protein
MEVTVEHQERPRAPLALSIQTWILGIIGTLLCASFGFFWNVNTTIATIKEQGLNRDNKMNELQQSINEVRLDQKTSSGVLQDVKERTIRVEDAVNSNNKGK